MATFREVWGEMGEDFITGIVAPEGREWVNGCETMYRLVNQSGREVFLCAPASEGCCFFKGETPLPEGFYPRRWCDAKLEVGVKVGLCHLRQEGKWVGPILICCNGAPDPKCG